MFCGMLLTKEIMIKLFDNAKSDVFIPEHSEQQLVMQYHFVILDIIKGEKQ